MSKEMTGAEMVIEALADQGVKHIFGYPGGAVLPIYDAIFQQKKVQHILVRTSRARSMPPKAMRVRPARSLRAGDLRSGRDQRRHRADRRALRLDSDRCHHRTGADPSDRQRPPSRSVTRSASHGLHQAQLSGEAHRGPAAGAARGVPHRLQRPPRSGGRRYSKDIQFAKGRLCQADKEFQHQGYRPKLKGDPNRIKEAIELMARAKRPVVLHRRRHHQLRAERQRAAARTGSSGRAFPSPRR